MREFLQQLSLSIPRSDAAAADAVLRAQDAAREVGGGDMRRGQGVGGRGICQRGGGWNCFTLAENLIFRD
jgi:hypothetical protein